MSCGASPHWPGVTSGAIGLRPPSAARWILQDRGRPGTVRVPHRGGGAGALFFFRDARLLLAGPGRVLVGTARGRVDADHAPVDPASADRRPPGRHAGSAPTCRPLTNAGDARRRSSRPETLGQVAPWYPGPHAKHDPVDHLAVTAPPAAALPGLGQLRLQPGPLGIGQITPPHAEHNEPRSGSHMIRRTAPRPPSRRTARSSRRVGDPRPWYPSSP